MATVTAEPSPVNLMTPTSDLADRLRRDVAFHRVAQLLADAVYCRGQQSPRGLTTMDPHEREWFKQTSRQLVEIFEQMTANREPDAVVDQREADAERRAVAASAALEARMAIERSRASVAAADRGHDMQPWHASLAEIHAGINRSKCYRCDRGVTITLGDEPVLSGPALTEGCLVAAETETR